MRIDGVLTDDRFFFLVDLVVSSFLSVSSFRPSVQQAPKEYRRIGVWNRYNMVECGECSKE